LTDTDITHYHRDSRDDPWKKIEDSTAKVLGEVSKYMDSPISLSYGDYSAELRPDAGFRIKMKKNF